MLLSQLTSDSQPIMATAPTSITKTAAAREKALERETKRLDFIEWSAIWEPLERVSSLPVLPGMEGDCISCFIVGTGRKIRRAIVKSIRAARLKPGDRSFRPRLTQATSCYSSFTNYTCT